MEQLSGAPHRQALAMSMKSFITLGPGANVINFLSVIYELFRPILMFVGNASSKIFFLCHYCYNQNKLDRLSLPSPFSLVKYLQRKKVYSIGIMVQYYEKKFP